MHREGSQSWETLAARQHGVLSRRQAVSLGMLRGKIERLLARGSWLRVLPGVYRAAAAPETWRQPLMAASLWAKGNAVVSGRSAAALWEFEGYWRTYVELCGLSDLSAPDGVHYRQVAYLVPADVATKAGIRVTSVARTIFDLAARVPKRTLERTLDEALRKELVTLKGLQRCIDRNGRRGRVGIVHLEALVAERGSQQVPDSPLETDVAGMIRHCGLPAPIKRHRVFEADRYIAEVDLAWPTQKVAVQVHGAGFHRQLRTWENDQDVENELQLHGWLVVKITARMLRDDPDAAIDTILRAFSSRAGSGERRSA